MFPTTTRFERFVEKQSGGQLVPTGINDFGVLNLWILLFLVKLLSNVQGLWHFRRPFRVFPVVSRCWHHRPDLFCYSGFFAKCEIDHNGLQTRGEARVVTSEHKESKFELSRPRMKSQFWPCFFRARERGLTCGELFSDVFTVLSFGKETPQTREGLQWELGTLTGRNLPVIRTWFMAFTIESFVGSSDHVFKRITGEWRLSAQKLLDSHCHSGFGLLPGALIRFDGLNWSSIARLERFDSGKMIREALIGPIRFWCDRANWSVLSRSSPRFQCWIHKAEWIVRIVPWLFLNKKLSIFWR